MDLITYWPFINYVTRDKVVCGGVWWGRAVNFRLKNGPVTRDRIYERPPLDRSLFLD